MAEMERRNRGILSIEKALEEFDKIILIDSRLHYISESETREILEIYYLYEFSNRIAVVAREQTFGSLWDYVATGLLTRKELVAALLA